jgi:hypothetical protein
MPRRLRRAAAIAALVTATSSLMPGVSSAAPVEHFQDTFVDPNFSAFLTSTCGYPVTVTLTERHTIVENDRVFVDTLHINGTVVGNGNEIELRTHNSVLTNDQNFISQGLIVQVRSAEGRLLVQYGGQLRTFEDGSEVLHPAFPEFDLCDFLD